MGKKQIALCLLCAMLFQLSACSENIDETTSPEKNPGNEAVQADTAGEEAIPEETKRFDMNWDDRSYLIIGVDNPNEYFRTFEVWAESMTGESLNDAIYERNLKIEEMYGIKFEYTMSHYDSNVVDGDHLRQIVMADEGYDLTFARTTTIGSLAAEGLMYNMYDLEYVDFSQHWWNQEINDTLSINNKLYFTSSDFLLHDKHRSYIIYYNSSMANEYQMGDLQTIAEEGEWTIDVMNSLGRQVARDVDNNSKYDHNDIWSVSGGAFKDAAMFTFAMGNKIMSKDDNGELYISMNTEHMISSIDKFLSLYAKNVSHFPEDLQNIAGTSDFWSYAGDIFNNGNALFRASILGVLPECSEKCEFEYKILPMPKYDETQENYITQPDDIALLMNIPVTTDDPDFAGFMLEVLSEESSKSTYPLYLELMTRTKYAPDQRSAALLEVIMDGVDYDLGFIYNIGELRYILTQSVPDKRTNNFASNFTRKQKKAQTALEELILQFKD